jgi:glycosyltransferase involved in cell wall biosynthesis
VITTKILFISHDDSRTGAPILLLNLSKVISANSQSIKIDFLLKQSFNVLQSEFQEQGRTIVLNSDKNSSKLIYRLYNKIFKRKNQKRIEKKIVGMKLQSYDMILSNTITNGDILPLVRKYYTGPILSYIHELVMASRYFTNNDLIKELIVSSDFFLFPSNAVKEFLSCSHLIEEDRLAYLPYYIPRIKINDQKSKPYNLGREFVIGACGTTDWRKGFDIFIQLVVFIKLKYPSHNIKFVWKGASQDLSLERANYDITKAGVSEMLEIQLSGNDMSYFWNSIDLFILTSREDPFPLVVLEAASFKTPTIAFQGSGGACEFISNDAGIVVPYLSIESMAEAIIRLKEKNSMLQSLGDGALSKLNKQYSDDKIVYSIFENILNLNAGNGN